MNRGYGKPHVDFLRQTFRVPNIITNPPFYHHSPLIFAEHALRLATRKVAMVFPTYEFWNDSLPRFMRTHPPKTIYLFPWRTHCIAAGSNRKSAVQLCWFVWDSHAFFESFPL